MSTILIHAAWCVVHVTLYGAALTVAATLAWRRGPATAAWVVGFGMALILLVTGFSLLPAPRVWSLPLSQQLGQRPSPVSTRQAIDTTATARPVVASELPFEALNTVAGDTVLMPGPIDPSALKPAPATHWPAWLTLVVVLGSLAAASTWFIHLALLDRFRRRARPLADQNALPAQVNALATRLGITRPIELRESSELRAPATLGWRRPVILLPADWRDYSPDVMQAVLAHELAHVSEGHYRSWIVARLACAVHFYHPLVRYLSRRLHLAQELAADALAAPLAGGNERYLRSLARVALATDGSPLPWALRSFLPSPSVLVERIAQLNRPSSSNEAKHKYGSTRRRWMWGAAIVVAAILVLGVREPAGDLIARATAAEPATGEQTQPAADDPVDRAKRSGAGSTSSATGGGTFGLQVASNARLAAEEGLDMSAIVPAKASVWFMMARGVPEFDAISKKLPGVLGEVDATKLAATGIAIVFEGDPSQKAPPRSGQITVLHFDEPVDWQSVWKKTNRQSIEKKVGERSYWLTDSRPRPALFMPDPATIWLTSEETMTWLLGEGYVDPPAKAQEVMAPWKNQSLLATIGQPVISTLFRLPLDAEKDQAIVTAMTSLNRMIMTRPTAKPDNRVSLLFDSQEQAQAAFDAFTPWMDKVNAWLQANPAKYSPNDIQRFYEAFQQPNGFAVELKERRVDVSLKMDLATRFFLPALDAAQQASGRELSTQNLKHLGLAWHNYQFDKKHFPPAAIYDAQGKPLLSWRVAILPFIEDPSCKQLYEQFHLDEPWDSEHNRTLIPKMPELYAGGLYVYTPGKSAEGAATDGQPGAGNRAGMTSVVSISGDHAILSPKGLAIREIIDGTSLSVALIETITDIPWTKPEDLPIAPAPVATKLGGIYKEGFLTAFADGSVHFIVSSIDQALWEKLLTVDGREPVQLP